MAIFTQFAASHKFMYTYSTVWNNNIVIQTASREDQRSQRLFVVVIKQILLPDRESWALQGASSSSESTENAVELRFWHEPFIIIIVKKNELMQK